MITMKVLNVTNWLMSNERNRVAAVFSYRYGCGKKINEATVTHHEIREFFFKEFGEYLGEKKFRQLASEVNSSINIFSVQDHIYASEMPSHVTMSY